MSAAAVQKDLERLRNAASSGVSYASPFRTAVRNIVAACRNSPAALASYCRAGVLGHLATAMQQVRHHHTADAAAVAYSLPLTLLLIEANAELDTVHPGHGATAFHAAAEAPRGRDCVEALVKAGCDTTIRDAQGKTGRERGKGSEGG